MIQCDSYSWFTGCCKVGENAIECSIRNLSNQLVIPSTVDEWIWFSSSVIFFSLVWIFIIIHNKKKQEKEE